MNFETGPFLNQTYLTKFNGEIERQIKSISSKGDTDLLNFARTIYPVNFKAQKLLQRSMEEGEMDPDEYKKKLQELQELDNFRLKVFKSAGFGEGVRFVKNRVNDFEEEFKGLEGME
jgi:hypothetical protein